MDKKYYIVIVAIILIIIGICYGVYGSEEAYRLTCNNAQSLKEYTSCVRLDTLINQ